jgi:hypothetical protein
MHDNEPVIIENRSMALSQPITEPIIKRTWMPSRSRTDQSYRWTTGKDDHDIDIG